MHGVHIDPDVARKAALHVAGHAQDAEDCLLLLDMLGLTGLPLRSSRTVRSREASRAHRARGRKSAS
jgi:hypothetical protein